jgi:hypothetical protein
MLTFLGCYSFERLADKVFGSILQRRTWTQELIDISRALVHFNLASFGSNEENHF